MEDVLKHSYLQLNRILMKEPQIHPPKKKKKSDKFACLPLSSICERNGHLHASWWVKEIKPQDFTFYTNQKVTAISFPACKCFKGILKEGVAHLLVQAIIIFLDYLSASW